MSVVQISQQTTLTGQELQNAITRMVQQLSSRSPYSMLNVQARWESGTRMVLSAGNHMTGAIDLQMGPPSTVTAQINLLSSLAEGQRSRVESDMIALANANLPRPGGAPSATPTHAPPAAPTEPGAAPTAPTTTPGRTFDWGTFGTVLTGIFGAGAEIVGAYNAVGDQAATDAVLIAQEEAGKTPSAIPAVSPGVQVGPGFTFGEGKAVGPDAPLPGGRLPSEVPPGEGVIEEVGFPTWGWWVIGIGGAAAFGVVAYLLTKKTSEYDDEFERNRRTLGRMSRMPESWWEGQRQEAINLSDSGYSFDEIADMLNQPYDRVVHWVTGVIADPFNRNDGRRSRETRAYKKAKSIGKRTKKSRDKHYPRSSMAREVLAMRAAGHSVSDIAAALGLSRHRVQTMLRAEIEKSKKMMSNYGFRYFL